MPNGMSRRITAHVLLVRRGGWSALVAFDFSRGSAVFLNKLFITLLSKCTDFITRYYDSCFYGCFVGAKLPLLLLFYAITYSGSMQKHAEYVTMMCRVCAMYCSPTRSTTNISMFRLWTELSTVFGINIHG